MGRIQELFDDAMVYDHDLQYPWKISMVEDFDCIIMDPPWYQDYYELFLLRATEILKHGGLLHTALFPAFAKTHGLQERAAIFNFIQNRGLHLISLLNGILEYEAPMFEKQTLSTTNFDNVPHSWRKGDLATLFQACKYGRDHTLQVETDEWKEFIVGSSKLKVRIPAGTISHYVAPSITPVEKDGPYFRSISRKDPKRAQIGLWTSKQQAFSIKGAYVIVILLDSLLNDETKNDTSQAVKAVEQEFQIAHDLAMEDCEECCEILKLIITREENNGGYYETG